MDVHARHWTTFNLVQTRKKTQQVILLSNENVGFRSNELEVVGEQWEPTMPFKDEVLVK